MRRVACMLIAVHAALSSNAAPGLWAVCVRPWKPAASEAFPCASHGCGCRTAEQCRTRCCCFPREAPIESSCCSKPVRMTVFDVLRCAGAGYPELPVMPAQAAGPVPEPVILIGAAATFADVATVRPVPPRTIDKVPL